MKTLVLLSGGIDSTTVLYHRLHEGDRVCALAVDYGQRHRRELDAAATIARRAGIALEVVAAGRIFGASALTEAGQSMPEGHYTDAGMKATVVPNRNMVFLALAGARALAQGCQAIAYGAHAGDHAIYPDCRPAFVEIMRQAFLLCHSQSLALLTPLLTLSKAEVVRLGAALHVPFVETWTCYVGGERHCGRCGACMERREAFQLARVQDETAYQTTTGEG